MSALSPGTSAAPYADPYRIRAEEGPQTLADLRAALALVSPLDLAAFEARLHGARLGAVPAVLTEYRHVLALRSSPEVAAAIADALDGTEKTMGMDDFFGMLDARPEGTDGTAAGEGGR
ncbi:hypothetical protein [Streptomyces sp. NPDC097619]|uniref:hypothetical protein n=1 Tax=Streptomyces sp. NPDC097619 TaxID=3157228 RepID=UPI00332BE177